MTKLQMPLRRQVARILRRREGIAATEFALLAPILMVMWLGMVEVTQAVSVDRKVTLVTRTLADLTTQVAVVNDTDLETIFSAAVSVLTPVPAQRLSMRITSFDVDQAGSAFVDWSSVKTLAPAPAYPFTAATRCTVDSSVPADLRNLKKPLVRAEMHFDHQPLVGIPRMPTAGDFSLVSDTLTLSDRLFMVPRNEGKVTKTGNPTSACPGYIS